MASLPPRLSTVSKPRSSTIIQPTIVKKDVTGQDETFRRHTKYFCLAVLCDGIISIILQIAESVVMYIYLTHLTSASHHYYGGLWNGILLIICGCLGVMSTCDHLQWHCFPVPVQRSIRRFIMPVFFAICLLTVLSSLVAMVLSVITYVNFSDMTAFADQEIKGAIIQKGIRGTKFHTIRKVCLGLRSFLILGLQFGLVLSVFTSAITLNRLSNYFGLADKDIQESDSTVDVVKIAKKRKAGGYNDPRSSPKYYSLLRKRVNEITGQEQFHVQTVSAEIAQPSRSTPAEGNAEFLDVATANSTKPLHLFGEFLRNRRISRTHDPVHSSCDNSDAGEEMQMQTVLPHYHADLAHVQNENVAVDSTTTVSSTEVTPDMQIH